MHVRAALLLRQQQFRQYSLQYTHSATTRTPNGSAFLPLSCAGKSAGSRTFTAGPATRPLGWGSPPKVTNLAVLTTCHDWQLLLSTGSGTYMCRLHLQPKSMGAPLKLCHGPPLRAKWAHTLDHVPAIHVTLTHVYTQPSLPTARSWSVHRSRTTERQYAAVKGVM